MNTLRSLYWESTRSVRFITILVCLLGALGMWARSDSKGGDLYLNGYLDDLRVTKGAARYTTAFTPPTVALLPLGASGITHIVPSSLTANTLHYWRCMYRDSDDVDSAWSTGTSFTTGYPPD